jgi:hypothetical protein
MRLSRTVVAAALAAGLGVAMVPAAYAANVPVISVPLPIPHYAHMLVDAAHQHLFISGGAGSTSILVTDYAGHPVATIAGETNAHGLALSGDVGRPAFSG